MNRLLAKLPRSSSGSREASASSSAAALPADIFDVSITDAAGLADFALVSSATCFSGASSGDFILIHGRDGSPSRPKIISCEAEVWDASEVHPYRFRIH